MGNLSYRFLLNNYLVFGKNQVIAVKNVYNFFYRTFLSTSYFFPHLVSNSYFLLVYLQGVGTVEMRGGCRSGGHLTRLESERDFSVGVRDTARGAAAAHARAPGPTPRATTLVTCVAHIGHML